MARLHALVIATLVGTAAPAAADVISLPSTKATITLDARWRTIDPTPIVAAYTSDLGHALAITRAQVPNPDAWRAKTRDAYVDEIERGVIARIPGYRRISRTVGEVHGVPTLDLEAGRKDGATIILRILLFRTYALALAIECPRKADVAIARAIAKSFTVPAPAIPAPAP